MFNFESIILRSAQKGRASMYMDTNPHLYTIQLMYSIIEPIYNISQPIINSP